MPMNIHIHYLLFVTLCGQFCSWVNKSYYYYYYYYTAEQVKNIKTKNIIQGV
jgi:hypothetical protein